MVRTPGKVGRILNQSQQASKQKTKKTVSRLKKPKSRVPLTKKMAEMRHRLRLKVLYYCLVGDEASVKAEAEAQGIVLLFGRR